MRGQRVRLTGARGSDAEIMHEGVMREAVLRDGRRHDMLLMGLLRSEWEHSLQPA